MQGKCYQLRTMVQDPSAPAQSLSGVKEDQTKAQLLKLGSEVPPNQTFFVLFLWLIFLLTILMLLFFLL